MPDPCFDTFSVASSAFSETRAFRNNRADPAKTHERNFCATFERNFPQLGRKFPQPSAISKSVPFACFAPALLNNAIRIFSLHRRVYQLVLQVGFYSTTKESRWLRFSSHPT